MEKELPDLAPDSPSVPSVTRPSPPPTESDRDEKVRMGLIRRLPWLFFRPRKFFSDYARSSSTLAVVACVYILGIAHGLAQLMTPENLGKPDASLAACSVFGQTAVIGAVSGVIYYFLLGSWYGVRVKLCKPDNFSWRLCRRTYIFSALVFSLPLAVSLACWWVMRGRVLLLAIGVLAGLLMLWSTYVSYCGVRRLFHAARGRAITLFVILPCIVYVSCFAVPVLLRESESYRARRLPRTSVGFETEQISMRHPAHWKVARGAPEGFVAFEISDMGLFMARIGWLDGTATLEEVSQGAVQAMAERFGPAKELGTFSTWGSYSGYGRRMLVTVEGRETIARSFHARLSNGEILVISETILAAMEVELEPQFEVVRRTFKVKRNR